VRVNKPPRWSARALTAFERTIAHIALDDPITASAVIARVDRSVELICLQPGIGTPTAMPGVRRYPVPSTGHVLTYRIANGEVRVLRWYRARRNV